MKTKKFILIGLFISFLLGLTLFESSAAHAQEESIQVIASQPLADANDVADNPDSISEGFFQDGLNYIWDWAKYFGWHLNPWAPDPEPEKPEFKIQYGFAWSG